MALNVPKHDRLTNISRIDPVNVFCGCSNPEADFFLDGD